MLLEFLSEYGMFFAKVVTFVIAAFLIIGAIASASHRPVADKSGVLHVKKLNEKYEGMEHAIRSMVMDPASLKAHD
ncbi:MAG: protease SohB, partial [Pseudomonadales bacterium]|nr:protease SohB [Pseudomonadales bacterium]